MSKVDRRHFLMSSVALPAALKASALQQSEQHGPRGRRRIQRPRQGAHLRVPEDAQRRDRGALRRRRGGPRRRLQDGRGGGQEAPGDATRTSASCSTTRASTPCRSRRPTSTTRCRRSGPCRRARTSWSRSRARTTCSRRSRSSRPSRKYNRIVQDGTGARPGSTRPKRQLKEGIIGDVYMARGLCFKWRDTIGRAKEEPVPAGVDYDLWIGPAPVKPFTRNRFHYNWHWQWDYGNGDLGNQGAHQMHAARFGARREVPDEDQLDGRALHVRRRPGNAQHAGRHVRVRRRRQEEDAGLRGAPLDHQQRGGHRRAVGCRRAGGAAGQPQTDRQHLVRIEGISGHRPRGMADVHGAEQAPGPKSEAGPGVGGFVNFIDVVRSRKREDQLAEIEEGAISTMLIHLANISYRTGRTLYFDPVTYTLQGGCGSDRDVHAPTVPRAVHRAERRRIRHRVGLELFRRKEAGDSEGQAGDGG